MCHEWYFSDVHQVAQCVISDVSVMLTRRIGILHDVSLMFTWRRSVLQVMFLCCSPGGAVCCMMFL